MGRPRKPTQVLEDTGAFKINPSRGLARANEPKSEGSIGAAPKFFDTEEREIWQEFVDEAPRGVLTKADRKILELAVALTRKKRVMRNRLTKPLNSFVRIMVANGLSEDEANEFKDAIRSMVGCSAQELSLLKACISSMGITPTDRSKVTVEPEKKPSRFAALAGAIGTPSRPN